MSFYSGIKVESSSIKDIKKYNYANSIMWKCYALWYLLTALMHSISPFVATIMLMLSCTLGLIILVYTYKQIEKKYKIETKEQKSIIQF